MKTYVPNYYKDFKCIADKCKHNCCIGWQIDIDDDSYNFYQILPGPLGDKLRSNIVLNTKDESAIAHFRLKDNKRCPFLQENNLCEIISDLSDEAICSICTEHPRFYNFWSNRTEIGLGLACEEAARIILSKKEKVTFELIEDDGENEEIENNEIELYQLRTELLNILQDRNTSTDQRIIKMLDYCHYPSDKLSFVEGNIDDIACEQLAVYLLYRTYGDVIYDGRLQDRINYIAENYCYIRNQWATNGKVDIDSLIEPARLFSQQIEYDTDTWGIEK